jgi:predicted PurR-regulated permease PerM
MAKPDPGSAPPPARHRLFVERLLITAAALALVLLLWWMRDLVVLIFGAVVTAVLLSVVAEPISRATGLGRSFSLAIAIGAIVLAASLLAFFFGSQIGAQFGELSSNLPQGWDDFRRAMAAYPGGRQVLAAVDTADGTGTAVLARMGKLLVAVSNGLLDLILIVVGGVFFAAQPLQYRSGFLKLLPPYWRPPVGDALDDSGRALRLWLRGQIISILLVGTLTWAGLALAGVPAAFALGTIAACLEVVPYIGPIVSAVPGLLLALALAPETALWALFVYVAVQQVEGNLIQPLVQKRVVRLPPAVTLFGMVAAGLLFGFLGVVFAAPGAVVAYVLLKRLYVREILHTATSVPGEPVDAAGEAGARP